MDKKKKEETAKKTTELMDLIAPVATSNVSIIMIAPDTWTFDTAALSNKTSSRDSLENTKTLCTRVANSQSMKVNGIGGVHHQCRLNNAPTVPAILKTIYSCRSSTTTVYSLRNNQPERLKMIGYGMVLSRGKTERKYSGQGYRESIQ